ncbi:MAG: hypothetical protein K2W96_19465, partial [Gemmataceae bacterium]|nr:hypothetical protein [Gemmataceae bacterium]
MAAAVAVGGLAGGLAWREAASQEQATEARHLLAGLDALADGLGEASACRCAFVAKADPALRARFDLVAAGVRRGLAGLGERARDVASLAGRQLALWEESVAARERQRFGDRRQHELGRQAHEAGEALRVVLA